MPSITLPLLAPLLLHLGKEATTTLKGEGEGEEAKDGAGLDRWPKIEKEMVEMAGKEAIEVVKDKEVKGRARLDHRLEIKEVVEIVGGEVVTMTRSDGKAEGGMRLDS